MMWTFCSIQISIKNNKDISFIEIISLNLEKSRAHGWKKWLFWIFFRKSRLHGWKDVHYVYDRVMGTCPRCRPWCSACIQQDACKLQGSSGVGIWWIKKKMKMLYEELQFNKAKVYTFVLSCNFLH
jgi:hypothetical protein